MNRTADHWIRTLRLEPHPEGGLFRETWRSPERAVQSALPERFGGDRALGTSIYYLLRAGEHSRLHRLRGDEVWHFHDGGPLLVHVLSPDGGYRQLRIGIDAQAGETLQAVIPHGSWFGAELGPGAPFALVGCTVAPGFEYEDFELGDRETLLARHPEHRELVLRFT